MGKKSKFIFAVVAVVLVLLCGGIYLLFFHERISERAVSVSPDGMYKCRVIERCSVGQSNGEVILWRRMSPWKPDWEMMDRGDIYNDSASRANYTINWMYNDKRRSTGIIVFGDFGGAPFSGTVVFQRALDPGAKLRGEQ